MSVATPFRRISIGLFVVAAILLLNGAGSSPAAAGQESRVTICHFPGHDGDFVTFNAESNPAGNPLCDARGGNAITVSESGCEHGHQAASDPAAGNRTCADGASQP